MVIWKNPKNSKTVSYSADLKINIIGQETFFQFHSTLPNFFGERFKQRLPISSHICKDKCFPISLEICKDEDYLFFKQM